MRLAHRPWSKACRSWPTRVLRVSLALGAVKVRIGGATRESADMRIFKRREKLRSRRTPCRPHFQHQRYTTGPKPSTTRAVKTTQLFRRLAVSAKPNPLTAATSQIAYQARNVQRILDTNPSGGAVACRWSIACRPWRASTINMALPADMALPQCWGLGC